MKAFIGEIIGTFVLVFIGCGSIGWALYIHPLVLWQIALIWGFGVFIAIQSSRLLSKSHLNPAVSFGFWAAGSLNRKELSKYIFGQVIGAFLAAMSLFLIFAPDLSQIQGASMFGEYYPNPGNDNLTEFSTLAAFFVEFSGTFLLMFGILMIIKIKSKSAHLLHPFLIGVLLSILIFCLAPYTQAGFNPARDLLPRLFSYLAGYSSAFTINGFGWFIVYVFAPIVGAILATYIYKLILQKIRPTKKGSA